VTKWFVDESSVHMYSHITIMHITKFKPCSSNKKSFIWQTNM